ncbi:hypothetical protein D7B24_002282 [Verticillium nonalfalfae]|uniref:Uncharacterized protein n=1 Tax=Verticillium nonalfalfae TaxID=1051616 RepID=A0A3M9Y208_9PEZI|nr:uncharacterized protein D7B24_002282 [Verticillium nonalfalfae]RNJ53170.1 hypothetical protein D7B24_002282 [Verticillium nonalfalfae]
MLHSYHYYILAAAGLVGNINALPLNINLGAYSPALVVGDGEISFGGKSDVNSLMNVLEGAAVNAAAGVANGQQPPPAQAAAVQQASDKPQPVIINPAPAAKGQPLTSDQQEAQQIASFLGIDGKQIDPAPGPPPRRDLSGFDRALRYAEAALVKGPKVQLGTGAEGSGVGIIVDNNQQAAARPGRGTEEGAATGGGGAAEGVVVAPASLKEKRGVEARQQQQPRRRAKVTTMYVRSGIPAGLSSSSPEVVARSIAADIAGNVVGGATVKREVAARDGAFDSVNLNVPGEGVTMTFVETADEEAEEPLDGEA